MPPKSERPDRRAQKRKIGTRTDEARARKPKIPLDASSLSGKESVKSDRPSRRKIKPRAAEKKQQALSSAELMQKEKRGFVDFSKLDMDALTRYKKHFRSFGGKMRKAELAVAISDHFATKIPIKESDEQDIVETFLSIVDGKARKLRR